VTAAVAIIPQDDFYIGQLVLNDENLVFRHGEPAGSKKFFIYDGVVTSPIYGVTGFGRIFDIPHVLSMPRPRHCALYIGLLYLAIFRV